MRRYRRTATAISGTARKLFNPALTILEVLEHAGRTKMIYIIQPAGARLGNTIERRVLQGLGYTYYEVVGKGETFGTLMAPPEGAPMVEQFVTAPPLLVRYNSRLPIVVYAPTDYQVRYRIWQASEVFNEAGRR